MAAVDIAVVLVRLVRVDCTWDWVAVVADIAVAVGLRRADLDLHHDLGVDRLDWGSNYSVHIVLVGVVALKAVGDNHIDSLLISGDLQVRLYSINGYVLLDVYSVVVD